MSQLIETVDRIFAERSTTIARDLKLNFKKLADESILGKEDTALVVVALAKAVDFPELMNAAKETAKALGSSDEVIQEAEENAAVMAMLNIYYRFRHFVEHADAGAKDAYGAAKLRMTSLANPAMGKVRFEMLAFAVSAINGCERCITSHEAVLKQHGVEIEKIHDLARLAAVTFGLKRLTQ